MLKGETLPKSRFHAFVSTAAICCGNAGPAMVYDALPPVLPQVTAHFGGGAGGEAIAQAAVALAVLGMGISGLFTSVVVARFGFRVTLAAGWLMFGVAGSAGLFLDSASLLLATRLVLGLNGGMLMAGAGLGIAARYDGSDRAKMMGWNLAVGAFTAILFLFVAAWMARFSWRAPFALHGVLALLGLALVAAARLPEVPRRATQAPPEGSFSQALAPAIPVYGLLLAMVVTGNLFNVQIVFLLASRGHGDPGALAAVCAIMPLALGMTNIAFGGIVAALGLARTVVLSQVLFVVGTCLCAASPSLVTTALGMICGGVALGLCTPSGMTLIMRDVEPARMPAALSFATTLLYAGGAIAPLIYVPLRAYVGHSGIYLVAGGSILAGLVTWAARSLAAQSIDGSMQGSAG